MKKITTIALLGFIGMVSHSASASTVKSHVWNAWRKDMCCEARRTDIQNCYKALYCPRGSERVNMQHHVVSRASQFSDDWNEVFTHCSADCVPAGHVHVSNTKCSSHS